MPATLSEKGTDVLLDLPPYEQDDPAIQALIDASSRELQRIEDYLNTVREKLRPHAADDEYQLLALWELMMGLPVEPTGISLATRKAIVLAAWKRRRAGAGIGWWNLISAVLGTEEWTHVENTAVDYQLTIEVPFESTDFRAGQLIDMLTRITPAHLSIVLIFAGGTRFIVGVSLVGDQL